MELEEVYRLRYKVYCEEWGFERCEDHPGGIEMDEFDEHAVHFIAQERDRNVIGTARIILNSEKGFPMEKHFTIDHDLSDLKRETVGEISRLAVSKEYRKRQEDRYIFQGINGFFDKTMPMKEKRRKQEIVVGLYKCIYRESLTLGITHWFAVMAKGLQALLRRLGIIFTPIGAPIDYHGIRTPYLGSIRDMEAELQRINPELMRELREGLKPPGSSAGISPLNYYRRKS